MPPTGLQALNALDPITLVGRLAARYTGSCWFSPPGNPKGPSISLYARRCRDSIPPGSGLFCALSALHHLLHRIASAGGIMASMSSRLFDSRRYHRRLSVSMPDHTAEELHGLAATAGVPVAAVIREAVRRALLAIRREIQRNAAGRTTEEGK